MPGKATREAQVIVDARAAIGADGFRSLPEGRLEVTRNHVAFRASSETDVTCIFVIPIELMSKITFYYDKGLLRKPESSYQANLNIKTISGFNISFDTPKRDFERIRQVLGEALVADDKFDLSSVPYKETFSRSESISDIESRHATGVSTS